MEQLREEKSLLQEERKTFADFLNGDDDGSLCSVKRTIEHIRAQGIEPFRLTSQSLNDIKAAYNKEKENAQQAQYDRAYERERVKVGLDMRQPEERAVLIFDVSRGQELTTELHKSATKYEAKTAELTTMLKQVEELKAERRILEQREDDFLVFKAEAIDKSKEQATQLIAASEREEKLRGRIEDAEKLLGEREKEKDDLKRQHVDMERR